MHELLSLAALHQVMLGMLRAYPQQQQEPPPPPPPPPQQQQQQQQQQQHQQQQEQQSRLDESARCGIGALRISPPPADDPADESSQVGSVAILGRGDPADDPADEVDEAGPSASDAARTLVTCERRILGAALGRLEARVFAQVCLTP